MSVHEKALEAMFGRVPAETWAKVGLGEITPPLPLPAMGEARWLSNDRVPEFLIWSEEHRRWWKPGGRGYTDLIAEAGRYFGHQAEAIMRDANFGSTFNEVAFPVPEGLDAFIRRSRLDHQPGKDGTNMAVMSREDHAEGKGPEPDPVDHVDERARELEATINARLAELSRETTVAEVTEIIGSMVPDGWEWVETTGVTGPRSIRFTRYGLA